MRARDKQEVIMLRHFLKHHKDTATGPELTQHLDDFAKFLELMRSINNRPELRDHDRHHLEAALHLAQKNIDLVAIDVHLAEVFGRHQPLDDWYRNNRYPSGPPTLELVGLLSQALQATAVPGVQW